MTLPKRRPLAALGESGLLKLLTGRWKYNSAQVLVGVGDDCAVLRGKRPGHFLLFKTDAVVEDVHFTAKTSPGLIGRKALARALSDLAAMGGRPLAALITLGIPATASPQRLKAIYAGMERLAAKYQVNLVGGETTRTRQLFINVALLGESRDGRPVLRSGARPGDLIFVTGRLGSTQKRHHLVFHPRLEEGQWLAKNGLVSAMMDLSDGLGADLPRLEQASGVSCILDRKALPLARNATVRSALDDGEDYELVFTATPRKAEILKKKWPFSTPLHCIGVVRPRGRRRVASAPAHGFDHFKQRGSRTSSRRKLGG